MGGRGGDLESGLIVFAELPRDVPCQEINCEQVVDPVQPMVTLQHSQIRVGHV